MSNMTHGGDWGDNGDNMHHDGNMDNMHHGGDHMQGHDDWDRDMQERYREAERGMDGGDWDRRDHDERSSGSVSLAAAFTAAALSIAATQL